MFIGMNFINGEFVSHRPEFHNNVGSFPLSTLSELEESKNSCISSYYDWNNTIYSDKINSIKNIKINLEKVYFYWKLESNNYLDQDIFNLKLKEIIQNPLILNNKSDEKFCIIYDNSDFFESLKYVISSLVQGFPIIIIPMNYRVCFQLFVEGVKNVTPLLGVINLLHLNEEYLCLFQKNK